MKRKAVKSMAMALIGVAIFSLSACDWQEDFHINSYELAQEYFPKYIESASQIMDKYNIEYTLETRIHHMKKDDSSYFYYTYTIDDDFLIQITMFYDDIEAEYSNFTVHLQYKTETLPQTREVCEEYSDMVNEIIYFFGYNVPEIGGLHLKLYENVLQEFDGSDLAIKWRYRDNRLFGVIWKGCYVALSFLDESQKYQVCLYGGFYLSDKNVWEE
jgi:hypothetical protein